jgi:hypothetical protein
MNITKSGNYHIKVEGICSSFESEPIKIEFLEAINPSVEYEDTVHIKKPVVITATGNKILWYDSQISDTPLFIGNKFITDTIDSYKVYWVENVDEYNIESLHTGIIDNLDKTTGSDNTNGGLVFDCLKEFTLKSVKVYATKKGKRRFQLKDADKNILAYRDTILSVGTHIINLNFKVSQGLDYRLETDRDTNLASIGTKAPQFYRDNNLTINFPYGNELISIKESYYGRNYYYYFYDWEVTEKSIECASYRIAIPIVYDPGSATIDIDENSISIYPNPVYDKLFINADTPIEKIEIFNVLGEKIHSVKYNNVNLIDLNIKYINNGSYFIMIYSNKGKAIRKFLKG